MFRWIRCDTSQLSRWMRCLWLRFLRVTDNPDGKQKTGNRDSGQRRAAADVKMSSMILQRSRSGRCDGLCTIALKPPEIGGHIGGRLVPVTAILLQQPHDDAVEVCRERRLYRRRRSGLRCQERAEDEGCRFSFKRMGTSRQFIENGTEAEEVR